MIANLVCVGIGIVMGVVGLTVFAVCRLAGDISRRTDEWIRGDCGPRGGGKR